MPTLRGTSKRDILRGANVTETILGFAGNDDLYGNGGNDTAKGGTGNDKLFGGTGNDKLLGEAGNDTLKGDAGNDTLTGGTANDILNGGSGTDTAVLATSWLAATVTQAGGGFRIAGPVTNGTDTVTGVERFKFTNGTFTAAQILNDAPTGGTDLNGGSVVVGNSFVVMSVAAFLATFSDADTPLGDTLTVLSIGGTDASQFSISGGSIVFNPTSLGAKSASITVVDSKGATNVHQISGIGIASPTPPSITELVAGSTGISFKVIDPDSATVLLTGPFVTTFANPTITVGQTTLLPVAAQATAVSGTLQVTDGLGTADVIRLYLGTSGADTHDFSALTQAAALYGFGGNDNLTGGAGHDWLDGGADGDNLNGGDGDDILLGGAGTDTLDGGTGTGDIASYENSAGAVVALLQPFSIFTVPTGDAASDTYLGLEGLRGTNNTTAATLQHLTVTYQDVLGGSNGANRLEGLGGNDVLNGGPSGDMLDGGAGQDAVSYLTSTTIITVDLGTPGNNTGEALGDTYSSIEDIIGSRAGTPFTGDTITGNSGNNRLYGLEGADTLNGGDGDDVLVGDNAFGLVVGGFSDILNGGNGSDTIDYSLNISLDELFIDLYLETASGGDDTDSISSIENAIGAGSNDYFFASAAANRFDGRAGTDTVSYKWSNAGVTGDLGSGTLSGGFASGDVLVDIERLEGSDHADTLTASAAGSLLSGLAGIDVLTGEGGNDTLYGGAEADTMTGGDGDDTYGYDNVGDVIVEVPTGGTDKVLASIDYTLGVNIENAEAITGGGSINLTGNGVANWLIGNAESNTLDGQGGNDILEGSAGDDTYIVDSPGDEVWEFGFADTDLVMSSVSYVDLSGQVENITLTGGGHNNATGNLLDNIITGNTGNNTLDGKGGGDTLEGGGGLDRFVLHADAAITITDFATSNDILVVSLSEFGLATLLEGLNYFSGASGPAGSGTAEMFFNETTGELWFDADGLAGDSVLVATLNHTGYLPGSDFDVLV